MKERHFFAGNNTAKGFYSYFDSIINLEEAEHYYILKGGPGVGKSSFMKNFASHMSSSGHSIEYVHCSGDKDSFDAIVIPELKIAFVDGTAPHTIDPKYPGAVDEIINLGYFFDSRQISKHKEEVIRTSKAKSLLYKSAYRYLDAARLIQEEIQTVYDSLTDTLLFQNLCKEMKDELFREGEGNEKCSGQSGRIRKLFSESYTTDGYISYTDSLCTGMKVWTILGENINYTAKLLEELRKEATKNGFDTECFYRPLTPEKLQHVFLPKLNLMIRSEEKEKGIASDKTIDLGYLMDAKKLETHSPEILEKTKLFDSLIDLALEKLSETKKLHGSLENIYVGSMDFDGVNKYFNTILARYE
ncbi:MAG: ATPase [Lachnospiraceae bacterium]|nr:ATPase [Lachnospiraceae bacterium]